MLGVLLLGARQGPLTAGCGAAALACCWKTGALDPLSVLTLPIDMFDWRQARTCGCPTRRARRGWTAPCPATAALTPWAWPSRLSTCRRALPTLESLNRVLIGQGPAGPGLSGSCDRRHAAGLVHNRLADRGNGSWQSGLSHGWQGSSVRNLGKLSAATMQRLPDGRALDALDPETLCGAQVDVDQPSAAAIQMLLAVRAPDALDPETLCGAQVDVDQLAEAIMQMLLAVRAPDAQNPKTLHGAQVDVDQLDQNAAVNKAGEIIGSFAKATGTKVSGDALQPYDEVRARPGTQSNMLVDQRRACLHSSGFILVGCG